MTTRLRPVLITALCGALAFIVSACGGSTGMRVVKECVRPDDQVGTFAGHWPTVASAPIPIAFQAGAFDSGEIADLIKAADTWNRFFEASASKKVFDYGSAEAPNESSVARPANSICGTGITQGNPYSGQVVIYKMGSWSGDHAVMALTSLCKTKGTPYNKYYNSMIELNYQDFYIEGKKVPDLVSIMTHEFGHLLGLDHSCESSRKTGMPLCSEPTIDDDYLTAVLFPAFSFYEDGSGEQRRTLNDNDMGRANCLYKTGT